MSNKQQLQTNNTKYASLIETLRGKAAGSTGEDVTDETNAYTTKLASLETAVAALETELEGKASGGSGGGVETCTVILQHYPDYGAYFTGYGVTVYDGVKITSIYGQQFSGSEFIVENVVCGSVVSISRGGNTTTVDATSNANVLSSTEGYKYGVEITAGADETVTITCRPAG